MEDRSEKLRAFFAKLICTAAKLSDPRIEEAFRTVKREPFASAGPWLFTLGGHEYVQTPDDDPAFLYQNLLLALDSERGINIGMPSAHAYWLGACEIKECSAACCWSAVPRRAPSGRRNSPAARSSSVASGCRTKRPATASRTPLERAGRT